MRFAVVSPLLACAVAVTVVLDGGAASHRFDGVGGLSAGASSRLLWDYPEDQAADILDVLYAPNHGAGLSICKVEIGGDCQSTDGTEPSHMHSRDDLSCDRGYEFWLLREAHKRNPAIKTYGLSWGVPYWVGNGSFFSADNWIYQTQFALCVKNSLGFELDYIGIWNERSWGTMDYVIGLRAALDAAGLQHTQIILPDNNVNVSAVMQLAAANATFNASFAGIGLHYQHDNPQPEVAIGGKVYWSSEDYSRPGNWDAAESWAQALVRNYVNANMTATIAWSTIWSVLPGLPYSGCGLMEASEPWSGHYNVSAPVWVSAHFGQFAAPGWRFLSTGAGSGVLGAPGTDAGAYVSLVPPSGLADVALIVETMGKAAVNITVALTGGLPGPGTALHVWQTTSDALFVPMPDVVVAGDGTFPLSLPGSAIVTVSTVATAAHGTPAHPVPSSAPFPLPYADDFSGYAYDAMPRYLSDQGGSFSVRNGSLVQVVPVRPGRNAWVDDPDPVTLLGDGTWSDVTLSATIAFAAVPAASSSWAPPVTSAAPPVATVSACNSSEGPQQAWQFGAVAPQYLSNAASALCLNADGCRAPLIYWPCITSGTTCCGDGCMEPLQFALGADGALTTPVLPGTCATAAANGTVDLQPCAAGGSAAQTWAYNASTGTLVNAGSGGCLTAPNSPPPPPPPAPEGSYASLCVRVQPDVRSGPVWWPAYCLEVRGNGTWLVHTADAVLGSGEVPAAAAAGGGGGRFGFDFDPTVPRLASITAKGSTVSAAIGGTPVGSWDDTTQKSGMASLGSGFHWAAFGALQVAPAS